LVIQQVARKELAESGGFVALMFPHSVTLHADLLKGLALCRLGIYYPEGIAYLLYRSHAPASLPLS